MPKYLDGTGLAELCSDIKTYFTGLLASYAPKNSPALTGTPTSTTPTSGDDSTKIATTAFVHDEVQQHAGIPVGFEYFTTNPNIPQGSLPLFGGEYSRTTYSDLWAWVQTQTDYCLTESDWQDLSDAQNGNVPFYSDGDGSTTFRVPSLKCWVKGANGTVTEVGSYLEAGLPNVTGSVAPAIATRVGTAYSTPVEGGTGAFWTSTKTTRPYFTETGQTTKEYDRTMNFDASRSNSIYGNSTTVQPESIVGMWLVKAYGTVVDTGTIDEQQYIDDRIAALPTSLVTTFVPYTGGTMKASLHTTPHVMEANYSGTVGNLEGEILNAVRYGKKGTPSGYQEYYTFAVARDNDASYTDTQPECRYATIEGHVNENGYASLEFRAYKNEADSKTNTSLVMGYGIGSSATEQYLQFADKRIDVSAIGTNYIRYGNGLQICWGIHGSGTSFTVTYPVAFNAEPAITVSPSTNVTVAISTSGRQTTGLVATLSSAAWFRYVAIGKWK